MDSLFVQMGVNSNGEEVEINDTDESNQEIGQINYKQQYLQLKKKLKLLLFVKKTLQIIALSNWLKLYVIIFRKTNFFKKTYVKTRRDSWKYPEIDPSYSTDY